MPRFLLCMAGCPLTLAQHVLYTQWNACARPQPWSPWRRASRWKGDGVRILVTGAGGFVGLHIVSELAAAGHTVLGLSRALPAPETRTALGEHVTFHIGDVRDHVAIEELVAAWQPTYIIHAAAITPSAEDEDARPREIVETNDLSTLTLLTAAVRAGVERLLFLSSAAVYAETAGDSPLSEDAPVRRHGGLYALTKLASEGYCRWAAGRYGLDARCVRIGPVYGFYERPTASRQAMSHVYRAVHLALRGETLRCNNPAAVYDWVSGEDVGQALLQLLTAPDLTRDTYNLAGEATTMERMVRAVTAAIPGSRVVWGSAEDANLPVPARNPRGPLDASALERDTGYRPRRTIESGIRAYVAALTSAGATTSGHAEA